MTAPADVARKRFVALTALRFSAAILIILGMAIALERFEFIGPDMAKPIGLVLIAVGAFDLLFFVPMLTRRWRSGSE